MAHLKDLIVNGASRFIGKVFINDSHIKTINGVEVTETPKFTDTTALGSMTGTLGVDHGGTGQTTGKNAANYFMNALDTGSSTPSDNDYYISQYVGGGTTTTTYHRRPISALWSYIKSKIDAAGYTTNTGTVTKVTAGTGLSIGTTAGGNFTTSGTINHTNAVTAQNTQAIYPIKIDAQGHISAYGSAVTPLTASSTLDATKLNGTIPTACLPSYVDDVLQYTVKADFPTTGETGKIYVDKTTNLTWRWSGSSYVEISPSLALGTTSSTAFRGDYGDAAYAHAVTNKGSAFSSGLYKITTNSEGHITAATAVQKSDITGLGIPGSNTNTIGEYAGSCIAGPNGIARYSLMMKIDETHWQSLVLSSSTGTTKVKNTSGFIIDSPILYESAGTYTNGTAAGQSACWHTISFDTRYSTNGGQFSTAGKPFYLVGTITNNKFYLANAWWADALPTTDSDNVYIYIGQMYSTYQCTLQSVHPIYIHKDGKIQEWFSTKHVLISTTQPTYQQPGDYWFVTEEHITLDYQQMPNDYGGNTAYIESSVQEN